MLRSIGVKGKPIGRWRSSGTDARKVLALLWPYLGGAKRAQAERALAGENNKGGVAPSLRTHCPKGHSYDGVRAGRIGRRCKRCDAERAREKRKTDKPHPKFRTHCPQGHDYATEGRVNSEGKRVCRICQRDARRRYEGRLKAAGEEHA